MDITQPHRAWKREWGSIADKLQVLIRNAAPAEHCTVVCGDGTHVRLGYVLPERSDMSIDTLTVSVPIPRGSEAAEIMDYGRERGMCRAGRGLFRRVPAACMIDLIWRFGGVDLPASREANK